MFQGQTIWMTDVWVTDPIPNPDPTNININRDLNPTNPKNYMCCCSNFCHDNGLLAKMSTCLTNICYTK